MPTGGEHRLPGAHVGPKSKNATPALGATAPPPASAKTPRVPACVGPMAARARGSLWMTNAMPSAPLPPSLAANTTLKDRVKFKMASLHAVPLCEGNASVSCRIVAEGNDATPFLVHNEKFCGKVSPGVALGVGLGVGLREGERVREPLAVGVTVADATVATLRTPWFA